MARQNDLKIREITKETNDTVSISFELPVELANDYKFTAGQYLTLRTQIEGKDVRRSYSICTSPNENDLRVAVKQIKNGLFSSYANKVLKIGDVLSVMKPMGRFTANINSNNNKHYVLFAVGSGITPILSIAKTVLEEEPNSTVSLFYGNKTTSTTIFKRQIDKLKDLNSTRFSVTYIYSRESKTTPIENGRINTEKCVELLNAYILIPNEIDDCFLCGPAEMITSTTKWLKEQGVQEEKIHFELFTSPIAKPTNTAAKETATTCKVTVIIDDEPIEFEMPMDGSKKILDVATDNGGDLPFACKGGVCCTCKAKVMEGKVEMVLNYSLDPEEVDEGYILTCQAVPKSEKVVIDFDEI